MANVMMPHALFHIRVRVLLDGPVSTASWISMNALHIRALMVQHASTGLPRTVASAVLVTSDTTAQ